MVSSCFCCLKRTTASFCFASCGVWFLGYQTEKKTCPHRQPSRCVGICLFASLMCVWCVLTRVIFWCSDWETNRLNSVKLKCNLCILSISSCKTLTAFYVIALFTSLDSLLFPPFIPHFLFFACIVNTFTVSGSGSARGEEQSVGRKPGPDGET